METSETKYYMRIAWKSVCQKLGHQFADTILKTNKRKRLFNSVDK